MNFIGRMEGQEIQVELKYCERCGGLWLRPQRTEGVYCAGCQMRLAARPTLEAAPTGKVRRRSARPGGFSAQRLGLQNAARIDCLQGVATPGVRA